MDAILAESISVFFFIEMNEAENTTYFVLALNFYFIFLQI